MKLVFSRQETANALAISVRQFDELRPALEAEGFPLPLPVLECWSFLEVIEWVNRRRKSAEACARGDAMVIPLPTKREAIR